MHARACTMQARERLPLATTTTATLRLHPPARGHTHTHAHPRRSHCRCCRGTLGEGWNYTGVYTIDTGSNVFEAANNKLDGEWGRRIRGAPPPCPRALARSLPGHPPALHAPPLPRCHPPTPAGALPTFLSASENGLQTLVTTDLTLMSFRCVRMPGRMRAWGACLGGCVFGAHAWADACLGACLCARRPPVPHPSTRPPPPSRPCPSLPPPIHPPHTHTRAQQCLRA